MPTDPPEIVLHTGTYKTATSTIQTVLGAHRAYLLSRYGILYPKTGGRRNTGSATPDSIAHHRLVHATRSREDPEGARQALRKSRMLTRKLATEIEALAPSRVIISSELVSLNGADGKRRFLELMPAGPKRVVYAVRRPDDMAESMLNQTLKAGRSRRGKALPKMPFLEDIRHWQDLVGPDSVKVLYFSPARYDRYLRNVFEVFGVDLDDPEIDAEVHDNPAMTQLGHLLRQVVFRRMAERGVNVGRVERHEINVALDQLEQPLAPSPKVVVLGPEDRAAIMKANADQFDQIAPLLDHEDRDAMRADLARPVSDGPSTLGQKPIMTAQTLAAISQGFAKGYLARALDFGR